MISENETAPRSALGVWKSYKLHQAPTGERLSAKPRRRQEFDRDQVEQLVPGISPGDDVQNEVKEILKRLKKKK
jgi:hypothetical protein